MEQNNQQSQNQNQNNNMQQSKQASAGKQSKKNLIISGIVILVVLALLLVLPRIGGSGGSSKSQKETDKTEEIDTTETDTAEVGAAGTKPLSRADAIVAYEGKSITVTGECDVMPKTQTQKVGTTIMVNNDTTSAHTVTVGPKSYRVSGLHYTLSWLNLAPGTLAITCDGKTTDATIVVE